MTVRQGRRYGSTTASGSAECSSRNRVRCTGETSSGFAHRLLFYATAEEFVATVPFLQCGLADDDALLAVTSEDNVRLLRDALGGAVDLVDFADSVDWYRHPAQTLAAYVDYVDGHPGQRVRIIGEPVWYGRTEAEIREWTRYESMCNAVFAETFLGGSN